MSLHSGDFHRHIFFLFGIFYTTIRLDTFERFQERSRDVRGVNSGPPLDNDFTVEGRYDTRRACDSTFPDDNKG